MSYIFTLEDFEGPLDLLLHLIQKDELDISDIPIARITEEYLRHIENLQELDLASAGDYLVMASTLMRIKARMLLPLPRPGEEPDEDPRQELIERLIEYKKYKEAASQLQDREIEQGRQFARPIDETLLQEVQKMGYEETFDVTLTQVTRALQVVLARVETVTTHEIEMEPISLEEKTALMHERLKVNGRLPFFDLFDPDRSRIEIIVTFMALLEILKRGEAHVHQNDNFSEIWIFSQDENALVEKENA